MARKNNKQPLSVMFNDISSLADFSRINGEKDLDKLRTALDHAKTSGSSDDLLRAYFDNIAVNLENGSIDEAGRLIAEASNSIESNIDLLYLELIYHLKLKNYNDALTAGRQYFELWEKCDPAESSRIFRSYDLFDDALWQASEAARRTANFTESRGYQKKSVERNPNNPFRRIIYASNLGRDGHVEEAIAVLDEGIKRFPREGAFENTKALIYGDAEMFDKAEQIINGILAKDPANIDAITNFGVILEKKGDYNRAEGLYKKALKIDPGHEIARSNLESLKKLIDDKPQKISLCMILKDEEHFLPGCLKTIEGLVDEIIVVDTGSTDRTKEIAAEYGAKIYDHPWQNDFSLHRNQSIDYATGDWILILDADEELDRSEHDMIRSAVKRKDIDAVSFVVYNKIQGGRTGFLNSHRLFRNKKEYRYSGIVHNQLMMDGITMSTQLKVFHHGYGLSEEKMNAKGKRSEALLLKQLEENPDNAFAHFNLAQIYRGLAEPEKSLKHALRVIDILSPENLDRRHVYVMALDQIGCAYVGINDCESAKKYFYKALELKDDYLDPLFNLGYVYSKENNYDKADELFHRYLEVKNRFSEHREWLGLILNNLNSEFAVYYGLGLSRYFRNDIDAALGYFLKVIDEVGDFEFTHHLIARCYRHKQDFSRVIEHAHQAISHGHEDAEIYILMGEAFLNTGEHKQASSSFEKALSFDSASGSSMLGLAGAASLRGDYKNAIEIIEKALEMSPNSPQVLAARGDLLYHASDFKSAADNYKNQIEANPNDPSPWNNLGNCLIKQQNYASAEYCYRRSLTLSSGFPLGNRNLAVCLLRQGKLEESAEYFELYIENNPSEYSLRMTLADIYYKLREYWKAITHIEHYLRANPDHLDAIIRMSDCYFNLNKLESAALGYKMVLKMDPDNSVANERLSRLNDYGQSVVT